MNFLYATLQKSKDQFGTVELLKKATRLLTKILTGLTSSNNLQDLILITQSIEKEWDLIRDVKIEGNYQYISPNQCSKLSQNKYGVIYINRGLNLNRLEMIKEIIFTKILLK